MKSFSNIELDAFFGKNLSVYQPTMTNPDSPNFRARCAELVELLEDEWSGVSHQPEALNRARAALATPPPEDNTKPGFINVCVEGPPPTPYEYWEDWLVDTCKNRTIQGVYIRALISGDFSFDKKEAATPPPEALRPIPVSERLQQMEDLAADAVAGLRYIEQCHGRLYGVGWDRVYEKADRHKPALATPPPEPPVDEERLADFTKWLAREMPPNTIIGDPLWWAPRIWRAVHKRWGQP